MKICDRHWFVALLLIVFIAGCSSGGGGGRVDTPLSDAKTITAFLFANYVTTSTIDENAKTIAVTVPNGTNITALIATFTTTGVSVRVGLTIQISGTTANNFTNPVTYTVTAADGTSTAYTVTVAATANSAKAITVFSFTSPTATGTIDENAKTIAVTVPNGINVTALIATFTTTGVSVNVGATVQVSGTTPNNFTNPVIFTIIAADGSTASYTVTVTVAASAAIGTISLPKTDQTTCYDSDHYAVINCSNTGQDGELQKGVAWPSPRFTNADNSTPINGNVVVDQLTGLMWTRDGNFTLQGPGACPAVALHFNTLLWQDALNYVTCLNNNIYLGYSDWRLPNIHELLSLLNLEQSNQAQWLTSQGFIDVNWNKYWSSTTDAANTQRAWTVNIESGYVPDSWLDKSIYPYSVWPVRTEKKGAVSLPKTGQVMSFFTGDDGDLQIGVDISDRRFTNPDGTTPITSGVVLDQLTGLIWTQDGHAPGPENCYPVTPGSWPAALSYVACLNNNNYFGYADWRLPNRIELMSLINYGQTNTVSWLNTQNFLNVQFLYWSSTTGAGDTLNAWYVDMLYGISGYDFAKDNNHDYLYAWPVRGGQ